MSNTRLFVSYALGRIIGGAIGGVIGVVFLTWLILGSSAVTVIGPSVFFQARTIMLNRVMASDELTLFRNRLDTIGIISSLSGSGLGMITPVSLDVVGWLSMMYSILILQVNVGQVKELEKMSKNRKIGA